MNLQKKLIQLSEYKCSFKYVDSYFLVSVTYPETWSVIPSEDRTIEVADEDGITFYAAPIETDIEKAFVLIDETIAYNLDVEKKMALLKYNIGKLQELFAEKDLEELETIEFTFKPKKTPKNAVVQPKKTKSTSKRGRKKAIQPKIEDADETEGMLNINKVDDSIALMVSNNSTPTENKYLEEVER